MKPTEVFGFFRAGEPHERWRSKLLFLLSSQEEEGRKEKQVVTCSSIIT